MQSSFYETAILLGIAAALGVIGKIVYDWLVGKNQTDQIKVYCPEHDRCMARAQSMEEKYQHLNDDHIRKTTEFNLSLREINKRLDRGDQKMKSLVDEITNVRSCLQQGFGDINKAIAVLSTKIDVLAEKRNGATNFATGSND